MAYVLGADIGTEGTKVVVVDARGQIVGKAYQSYSFEVQRSGWAEQAPDMWWEAFKACLKELWTAGFRPADMSAIGVAGQMHSSVLLDEHGAVIMKSILWNDTRTKAICDEALESFGRNRYQAETCNSLLPGFTLGKLLWVRENLPEQYSQIEHVLMPKDYVNFRLTGLYAADVTDASGTGVFDVRERRWKEGLIAEFGLPRTWFPEVFESSRTVGFVSQSAGRETGLSPDTLVIAGAADNAAAAVGMGVVRPERGLVSVGTSGVVLCCLEHPPDAEQAAKQNSTLHVFCHAVPGMWYGMGVTLAAGASLRWLRDSLSGGRTYSELIEKAASIECGSSGLFYFPFLAGERTPYNSDRMRAAFLGVHMGHQLSHFVRSVIEGVSYSLRDCLNVVHSVSGDVNEFIITGGAVNSSLWLQVLSDVLDAKLIVPNYSEGAALGAALLAGIAGGHWSGLEEAFMERSPMHHVDQSMERDFYQRQYRQYKIYAESLLRASAAVKELAVRQ
ncbi:xylulose kinase [Peptococcaceae bacterium CEB3]|nr:xylulose kinase [Peptococcaceae bacterium CEB3]